jgi:hypothetical protein
MQGKSGANRRTDKVLSLDEVTFAPGNGDREVTNHRYAYGEIYSVDFGGIVDREGRAVGYQLILRSPDLTAREYSHIDPKQLDKWEVWGSFTRDGAMFGGSSSDTKYMEDRNACVALAKKMLAKAYKYSVKKFGAPAAKIASRVLTRYLAKLAP